MADKDFVDKITKDLTDQGLIVGAGFAAFQIYMIPEWASEAQVLDMRMAYFAGAQHLYASILSVLDPGDEPTDKDMNRIRLIHEELEAFRLKMEKVLDKGSMQ